MKLLRIALALAAFLPATAFAQTPTSNVYAFTRLTPPAYLGTDALTDAIGIFGSVAVGYGYGSGTGGATNALRYDADGTITNLHNLANLGANASSEAYGISGGVTVGAGRGDATGGTFHALRWNADGSVTDLNAFANLGANPFSQARAIQNGVVIGNGSRDNTNISNVALRWNADNSVVNLHEQIGASGMNLGVGSISYATALSGGVTVGAGRGANTQFQRNALRWNPDATVTSLHTAANLGRGGESVANGFADGITVGFGRRLNAQGSFLPSNALRWNADGSVTNLHNTANLAADFRSFATATAGGVTVGYAFDGFGNSDALLWSADGTALNLQAFVSGADNSSVSAVDAQTGVIAGIAGTNAALWTPLNAGINGANSLSVAAGVTTTINRDFMQSAGSTRVNGVLDMVGNTFTLAGGTLGGAGNVTGNIVVTGGILAPGNPPGTLLSPGTLSITGNFAFGGGAFAIELASMSVFDRVNVSGTATFTGGSLAVVLTGGYLPQIGDSFDIVTAGARLSGVSMVSAPAGYTFSQIGNTGRLTFVGATVVPEVGSLSLLLCATTFCAFAVRRRFAL